MQNNYDPNARPTFVPIKMEERFSTSYSHCPKMQSAKQFEPPRVACPCQFPCNGEKVLVFQSFPPLVSSGRQASYSLSPWYGHAWPALWRDVPQINLQALAFAKAKKHVHFREPKKDKPQCKICNKSFSRKSSLVVHMRSHSGEKPFKCVHCPKAFAQSANLVAHLRTHTGEKPYPCSVCGKCFSQSSSVTTHMRTHTGERPFQCAECGMAFAERSTLSKHKRVHTKKLYMAKAI